MSVFCKTVEIAVIILFTQDEFVKAIIDVVSVVRVWHKRYDISSPQYRQFTNKLNYHLHRTNSYKHMRIHTHAHTHTKIRMFTFSSLRSPICFQMMSHLLNLITFMWCTKLSRIWMMNDSKYNCIKFKLTKKQQQWKILCM